MLLGAAALRHSIITGGFNCWYLIYSSSCVGW